MRPYNAANRRKLFERNFGDHSDWIRARRCHTCKRWGTRHNPIEASHSRTRGAGADRRKLFPQCRECHELYEVHRGPPWTREEADAIAAEYWARSPFNDDDGRIPEEAWKW